MKIPPCFNCGKEFENLGDKVKEGINQPAGGLAFMTNGHYGSAEFDSASPDRWLEINICDGCIAEKRNSVLHVVKLPQGFTTPLMMETWNPYKHGG